MFRRVTRFLQAGKPLPPYAGPTPKPYTGPSKEAIHQLRMKHSHPALFLHYKQPIMIVEGHMQYMFDETGKRHLDLFGGIVTVSVGHSHPRIVEAIRDQSSKIVHTTTMYLHPAVCELSQRITSKLPNPDDWVVYVTNSGSEANDLVLLMARAHTGRSTVVSLRNGYHGMSEGTRTLTTVNKWIHKGPRCGGYAKAMVPDPYHHWAAIEFGATPAQVRDIAVKDLRSMVENEVGASNVAAFIAERYQGVGGTVPLADGYLPEAYKIIRDECGGLCASDEVQCGFGRLGSHYWGFESAGVTPDFVTMAKSLGNGIPIGAVAARREIAQSVASTLHFNTYGGNPVSSRVACEVMQIIEDDNLQAHCGEMGDLFLAGMRSLQDKYEIIGDVRGQGLLLGMEFVKDRATRAPAAAECAAFHDALRQDYSIIMGKGGAYGNVFRVKPPMCIQRADVEYTLWALDDLLGKYYANGKKL
eukprot:PhM_4_TR10501/c0_g1_i1/m.106093/K00827/AGXT2; alanine-glyoxylate transaminase / (R)-3-amino-2-methylpropionate-pyruvate transaminase